MLANGWFLQLRAPSLVSRVRWAATLPGASELLPSGSGVQVRDYDIVSYYRRQWKSGLGPTRTQFNLWWRGTPAHPELVEGRGNLDEAGHTSTNRRCYGRRDCHATLAMTKWVRVRVWARRLRRLVIRLERSVAIQWPKDKVVGAIASASASAFLRRESNLAGISLTGRR